MTTKTMLPSPFRMVPLARLAKGGRWRTEAMRSYGAPVLYWFARGQGRITVNGVTAGYGPHNVVFMPAGAMHGFEMNVNVHGTIVVFPSGLDDQLDLPQRPLHLRLRDAERHSELARLIDNLQREVDAGEHFAEKAMLCHAGLLAVWLKRQIEHEEKAPGRKDAAGRLAAAYTELVEHGFHSPKTVGDYASELGVTPTHLSRVCNKACGRAASTILADRVHYEARRLLTETHLPIKEIAQSLGFSSAAYFTRAFHNYTGRTPSDFRRTH